MRLFRIPADDANAVMKVRLGPRDRLPVDDPDQRPQRQIDENDKAGRQRRMQRMATSRQKPHGRRAPQRGCGVEAGNLQPLAKDDACTQKADPGDNLGGYPRGLPSSANKPSNITNLASPIAPSLFFRKPSIL